ncbi:MAG: hypothetical protein WC866_03505 [Patescibacteria group bacterium]|jgi:hypothetical protein
MYALRWFSQAFAFSLILFIFSILMFGGFVGTFVSALFFALTMKGMMLGAFFGACACTSIGMMGLSYLDPDYADF